MSDGPHKTLPMKRAWKRVAERADNRAFSVEQVTAAIAPALEQDCRADIDPQFIRDIRAALDDSNGYLFKVDVKSLMDRFRSEAASGMDRAILDNVCAISSEDAAGIDILLKAVEGVVGDRAARNARQVEEHYLRRSSTSRAGHVRDKLEEAIANTNIGEIAARVLNGTQTSHAPLKQSRLDDGVELP